MRLLLEEVPPTASNEERAIAIKDCIIFGESIHNIFLALERVVTVGGRQMRELTSANQFRKKHPELFEDLEE